VLLILLLANSASLLAFQGDIGTPGKKSVVPASTRAHPAPH
jgi:hypothetical protein